jgi:hypothetical protein
VDRAREQLEREQRWVREQLERMRRAASEQGRERLTGESKHQQELADRAKRIAERARTGENPVPGSTMELLERAESAMRDAAKALDKADGEQRLLEAASESLQEPSRESADAQTKGKDPHDKGEQEGSEEGDGKDVAKGPVDIPSADAFTGPEAFRRRVVEGLSRPADPSLRDAVRRYTEGLLR